MATWSRAKVNRKLKHDRPARRQVLYLSTVDSRYLDRAYLE